MNEVNIEVTSDDHTKPGFLSARREAASFSDGMSKMFSGLVGIAKGAAADLASSLAGPLVAGAGATVAAFASAGAAVGAFGLAVAPQLKQVTDLEADLSKLPPATAEAAVAFRGLRSDFLKWSDSLSGDTMPVFTKGIGVLRTLLPSLTPLVKAGAGALSGFMDTLAKDAQGGGIQKFVNQLAGAARKTLPDLLASLRNVGIGLGGIISAFLPFSDKISGGLEDLTAKFADFGQGLADNQGFQDWMASVSDEAPGIIDMLGDLVKIVMNVAEAMAPFTGVTLKVTEALAGFVAAIPQGVMDWLAPTIGGIVLAVKAWSVAQGLLNVVLAANPIGLVVIAIAALAGGLIYAYKHSESFRRLVDKAFSVAKEKGQDLWDALRPALKKMGELLGETLPEAAAVLADGLDKLAEKAQGVAEKILGINGSLEETPESGGGVIDWFKENWEPVIGTIIAGPLGGAVGAIEDKFGLMGEAFTNGGQFLRDNFGKTWDRLNRTAVNGAERIASSVHRNIGATIDHLLSPWPGAQKRFSSFWSGLGSRARSGANTIASHAMSLSRRIASIRPSWSGLWSGLASAGSRVTSILQGILNRARSIGSQITGAIGHIPGFASGGISHAAEGGPRGNLAMVGEHGRELVRLPFGSTVIPNGQTEAMMAGGGGGGTPRLVFAGGPTDELGAAIWEWIKKNVRLEGGGGDDNVQRALG